MGSVSSWGTSNVGRGAFSSSGLTSRVFSVGLGWCEYCSSWGTSEVGRGGSSSSGSTGASSSFGSTSRVFWVGWGCDVVYGKSPISPGGGGFIYIEGPIRPEIQLGF